MKQRGETHQEDSNHHSTVKFPQSHACLLFKKSRRPPKYAETALQQNITNGLRCDSDLIQIIR